MQRKSTKKVAKAQGNGLYREMAVEMEQEFHDRTKNLLSSKEVGRTPGGLYRKAQLGEQPQASLLEEDTNEVLQLVSVPEEKSPKDPAPKVEAPKASKAPKAEASKGASENNQPAEPKAAEPGQKADPDNKTPSEEQSSAKLPKILSGLGPLARRRAQLAAERRANGGQEPTDNKDEAETGTTEQPTEGQVEPKRTKMAATKTKKKAAPKKAAPKKAAPKKAAPKKAAPKKAAPKKAAPKKAAKKVAKTAPKPVKKAAPKKAADGSSNGKPASGQSGPKVDLAKKKLNPKEVKVLASLCNGKGTQKITDLAALFKGKSKEQANSWVRNSLRRLVRGELVEQVERGTYKATDKGKKKVAQAEA